jgi:TPR repeat protein
MVNRVFAALALAVSLVVTGAATALANEHLSNGLDAYQARKYDEALKHFRHATDDGNAEAPFRLGAMYFNGHGVSQDRDEAARWFREAAVRGNREAQYILGVIYWDGRGVPTNRVLSYMWFNIASSNGSESAVASGGRIAASLSSPDIAEAERRARICLESHYQDCD